MTDRHWTPRETEIVRLTTEGLTAQQIARRLTLAPKTVENHIWRAKQKAGCPNRAALVRYAITRGLVDPPPRPGPEDVDRADAELDLLIRHLDTGTVIDHLDADTVIDVVEPEEEPEEPREPRRPTRGVVVAVLVILTLAGGTVYLIRLPDAPTAVIDTPPSSATSSISLTPSPTTTSHKAAPGKTAEKRRTTTTR
jgi:DNA-binding CsgD family transcriptional regulator